MVAFQKITPLRGMSSTGVMNPSLAEGAVLAPQVPEMQEGRSVADSALIMATSSGDSHDSFWSKSATTRFAVGRSFVPESLKPQESHGLLSERKLPAQLSIMAASMGLLTGCLNWEVINPLMMDVTHHSPLFLWMASTVYLSVNALILGGAVKEFKGSVIQGDSWSRLFYFSMYTLLFVGAYGFYDGLVDPVSFANFNGISDNNPFPLFMMIGESVSLCFVTGIGLLPFWVGNLVIQKFLEEGVDLEAFLRAKTLENGHFVTFQYYLQLGQVHKRECVKMLELLENPIEEHWQVPVYIRKLSQVLVDTILNNSLEEKTKLYPAWLLEKLLNEYPDVTVGVGIEKLEKTYQFLLNSKNLDLQGMGWKLKKEVDELQVTISEELKGIQRLRDEAYSSTTSSLENNQRKQVLRKAQAAKASGTNSQ